MLEQGILISKISTFWSISAGRVGGWGVGGLNELCMPIQHTSIAEGRYVFQFLRCFEQNLIIQTMDQKALCSTGQV